MTRPALRQVLGDMPPEAVLEEVENALGMVAPDMDLAPVRKTHADAVRMFRGEFPGYQASNNAYHDLEHTMHVFLAMSRLLFGAIDNGEPLHRRDVVLGLIGALFHDIGFIMTEGDTEGTGAKYTSVHEERGIEFARNYLGKHDFDSTDSKTVESMLHCTCLRQPVDAITFVSDSDRRLAKLLGTADLLGQMGDRRYLQKLPHLYLEFKEADIGGYDSELDLLDKTSGFWTYIQQRLEGPLASAHEYARAYFRVRFGIDRNLYLDIIEHQIRYLEDVLAHHRDNYRDYLGRDHVETMLRQLLGDRMS